MFDRRKRQGGSNNGGSSNGVGSDKRNDEEGIEFTAMTNQQRERVPLVARMEVIQKRWYCIESTDEKS